VSGQKRRKSLFGNLKNEVKTLLYKLNYVQKILLAIKCNKYLLVVCKYDKGCLPPEGLPEPPEPAEEHLAVLLESQMPSQHGRTLCTSGIHSLHYMV
jgi:hypothetical protein